MDETKIEALKKGAAVLYQTLQNVALLHEVKTFEGEEGDVDGCVHCSDIAEAIVHAPCPTMRLVLNDFEQEETPAE
jgi:hypothetical protein